MQPRTLFKSTKLISSAFSLASISLSWAGFVPLVLTPQSYNQDVVVEKTASPPLVPVTTATMDAGVANTDYTWYERGYKVDWPGSGLPPAGTSISPTGDHLYRFASSYQENNVLLIDSQNRNGRLTLMKPSAYGLMSFLVSGGNGGGTVGYTISHQDGSTQTGRLNCRDWLSGPNAVFTAAGRVSVSSFTFDLNSTTPRLFTVDVPMTNSVSPVTSVDFDYTAGLGREVVFAISGAPLAYDPVGPIGVNGYNADVVVEASSTKPDALLGFTTAAMEDGTANAGRTWYEQGYYAPVSGSGLPPAGSEFTSANASDHRYALAPSYTANNVVLLDASHADATITLATPSRYSALSFLTSSGHGPVTNRCIVTHVDGTSQTNSIVSPDWAASGPGALCGGGRIRVGKPLVDGVGSDYPNLYSVDLNLKNTNSPVKALLLSFTGGPLNSHAAIFALSGADSSVPPPVLEPSTLSIVPGSAGGWVLSSSRPGSLQSTTDFRGAGTIWKAEGFISGKQTISPAPGERAKFYRVISQ